MNLNLEGKVALVTGAGAGIGARISARFVAEGCTVYVTDINAEAANVTAAGIGPAAHAMRIDVTKPNDVQLRVQEIVERHGAIDILVNNAGILKTGSIVESSIEDWEEVCRANLSSVYYCSKAVLPIMLKRRYGKIVNIASMSAARAGGVFGNVLYGTTKAGVVAFTKGFARELAPYGINVNAVAPGLVETAMTSAKLTPDIREQVLRNRSGGARRHAVPERTQALDALLWRIAGNQGAVDGAHRHSVLSNATARCLTRRR